MYCRKTKGSTSYSKLSPSKYDPPDCIQWFQHCFRFKRMSGRQPCLGMSYRCHFVFSCIFATSWNRFSAGCSSAWGRGAESGKASEEPRGCCARRRILWHSEPRDMAHCRGAEAMYRKTICEAVSDTLLLECAEECFYRQFDSWPGLWEETRYAPDPPRQRKRSALSWRLTELASHSSAEVTTTYTIVTTFVLSRGCSHKSMIHLLRPSFQLSGRTWCKHVVQFNTSISQYNG